MPNDGMVHLLMWACVSLYALRVCLCWCIKKASDGRGGYFAYVSLSVSACERHCYVEGENEDSCSFFASLIEFN